MRGQDAPGVRSGGRRPTDRPGCREVPIHSSARSATRKSSSSRRRSNTKSRAFTRSGSTKTCAGSSPTKSFRRSKALATTKSATSSLKTSGCVAIRIRTPPKTSTATTHYAPHCVRERALSCGGQTGLDAPIAATSISRSASRIRSTRTPRGGNYERPMEEGGGSTSTFPFEVMALPIS